MMEGQNQLYSEPTDCPPSGRRAMILVLQDSKIVEKRVSMRELLGMHGFYADIYNAQFARG